MTSPAGTIGGRGKPPKTEYLFRTGDRASVPQTHTPPPGAPTVHDTRRTYTRHVAA